MSVAVMAVSRNHIFACSDLGAYGNNIAHTSDLNNKVWRTGNTAIGFAGDAYVCDLAKAMLCADEFIVMDARDKDMPERNVGVMFDSFREIDNDLWDNIKARGGPENWRGLSDGAIREAWGEYKDIARRMKHYIELDMGGAEYNFGMLIGSLAGVFYVDKAFSVTRIDKFAAIGAGEQYAYGYMRARYEREPTETGEYKDVLFGAVLAAAKYSPYCDGVSEIIHIEAEGHL